MSKRNAYYYCIRWSLSSYKPGPTYSPLAALRRWSPNATTTMFRQVKIRDAHRVQWREFKTASERWVYIINLSPCNDNLGSHLSLRGQRHGVPRNLRIENNHKLYAAAAAHRIHRSYITQIFITKTYISNHGLIFILYYIHTKNTQFLTHLLPWFD